MHSSPATASTASPRTFIPSATSYTSPGLPHIMKSPLPSTSPTHRSPASSRSLPSGKRSRITEDDLLDPSLIENESPNKGGHTLRRRARVDYTFEHIDDDVLVPNSTSTTRSKKRSSDNSLESRVSSAHDDPHRRASLDANTFSSRRRNPVRKTSEVATYTEPPDEDDRFAHNMLHTAASPSKPPRTSPTRKSDEQHTPALPDATFTSQKDIPSHLSHTSNLANDNQSILSPTQDTLMASFKDNGAHHDTITPSTQIEETLRDTAQLVHPPQSKDVVKTDAPHNLKNAPHLSPAIAVSKPQPAPLGRWAYLTPYREGKYVTYPEKKESTPEEDTTPEEPTSEDKEAEKGSNSIESVAQDNDDALAPSHPDLSTPVVNTPTRASPLQESVEPTAANSPAPALDEADDADAAGSGSEVADTKRFYRYKKLRDANDYLAALENHQDMSTPDLYQLLQAVNVSMVQWQTEWSQLGKIVDDYENSHRRRLADAKYEARTRNLQQHGVNHEEPEFVVKGYRAKERETMTETRYLQSQDRLLTTVYGCELDPHPSKIGRQEPREQQFGSSRGRMLRNQPKQTVKATETEEVTGKRLRKPPQLYDPAAQDASRGSTPIPRGTRRRRNGAVNGNADDDVAPPHLNGDAHSDAEEEPLSRAKRRRGGGNGGMRPQPSAPNNADDAASAASKGTRQDATHDETVRIGRRSRHRLSVRYDDGDVDAATQDEDKSAEPKSRLLTLKLPGSLREPSSSITDNGESPPCSPSSETSSRTAESSYSLRPKRRKRFRDDDDEEADIAAHQGPPKKKRGRQARDDVTSTPSGLSAEATAARKTTKIKFVRQDESSRTDTPSSVGAGDADADADEAPVKDYKLMTKSEKMSASMKSRWANGNMAGAVEKRKATLAAKKAAQVAADARQGSASSSAVKAKGKMAKKAGASKQDAKSTAPSSDVGHSVTDA